METREDFVDSLTARFREEVDRGLAELEALGPPTMDQIEEMVERVRLRICRELTQRILDRQPDEQANAATCRHCSARGRYHSCILRVLVTRHGELHLVRRWFRCGACGRGFSPLDRQLGLDSGATTSWLRELTAEWAADRTFERLVRDLLRSRGVVLGESTAERIAVACGERLRAAAQQEGADFEAGRPHKPVHHPKVVYLGMDGVYAPLRDPWKKDGTAGDLVCRGGECKVGMAYEVVKDARGRDRVSWREYTATFADIEAFRPQMAALAHRCGVFEAGVKQVFLADTLACNWNVAADYFPDAVQIVDWRHALTHIKTVETAFFGESTGPGMAWFKARESELWAGNALEVAAGIRELPVLPQETEVQADVRRREGNYFESNQERMRYQEFRELGYQIGSGVLEASCRTVVNQRMDQSGMHWRRETADSMVALRAATPSSTKPNLTDVLHGRLSAMCPTCESHPFSV